jgi:hypothetical protein
MPTMMPKMIAAVLMAVVLSLSAPPAYSVDSATANDTARFLAGMQPAPTSPLSGLTSDSLWQQHARRFDALFGREESTKLSRIRAFSQQRLTEKHDTMLYMFGGPDFLYATTFFPNASTYVLAGLEQIGDVPPLTSLSHGTVDQTLQGLEGSLGTILNFSFFITKKMKTELYNGPVTGTLPILYVFLARTGKTIHEVSFVGLDQAGNFVSPGGRSASRGVKIVFSDGFGAKKTLYYFSTNLADDSIGQTGFLQFCASLGPADSFIKSASYLLQTGRFNKLRNFLLDRSATILQDDTGIPIAYFDPKMWRFQAFGHYSGPLNISGATYQARMGELFRNAIPIDFGVGYRWRINESNLVLAQRVAYGSNNSALAPPLPSDQYAHKKIERPHNKVGLQQQPSKKPVENEPRIEQRGVLGCGIPGIFSFCSNSETKATQ